MSQCGPSVRQVLAGRFMTLAAHGAPEGTSHVLWYYPATGPDSACWDLQPVRAWLSGKPLDQAPAYAGPTAVPETTLAAFTAPALGHPAQLTPIGAVMGRTLAVPASWVRPA